MGREPSSWTPLTSGILLGGVLVHLRDGGVAAVRVGAGTAQIRRSDGEMSANNFYRDFGELSIPLFALLAMAVRCPLLPELAQNLARCAAAP